jgi:acyl phosphate:glycerol-3-phosphate acyltransferase
MSVLDVVAVAGAYLLGTFPSALFVGRWQGVDPTRVGSGNPGATNVLRTVGRRAAAFTLIGDLGKGALAAGAGWGLGGRSLGIACGVAAVAGHVLPISRRFRGGRGVATAGGMVIVLFPLSAAVAAGGFAIALALTRIAAVASLIATVLVVGTAAVLAAPRAELVGLGICAAIIVVRHTGNMRRLIRGVEPAARRTPGSSDVS